MDSSEGHGEDTHKGAQGTVTIIDESSGGDTGGDMEDPWSDSCWT